MKLMEKIPDVIQNKIMYLTLSHPIAEMIKHTKWFYELKYRAENTCFTISDIQVDLGDIEGECIHCGIELHSKECIKCCCAHNSPINSSLYLNSNFLI